MNIVVLGILLGGLIIVLGLLEIALRIRDRLRQRAETSDRARPSAPPMYAVGSPEYNAQIVDAIRQVNERLAPEGKHVPERVAMDIILQQTHGIQEHPGADDETL
jgi:hypothetical protein